MRMGTTKKLGLMLSVLSAGFVVGLVLKDPVYWEIITFIGVMICSMTGIYLIIKSKEVG